MLVEPMAAGWVVSQEAGVSWEAEMEGVSAAALEGRREVPMEASPADATEAGVGASWVARWEERMAEHMEAAEAAEEERAEGVTEAAVEDMQAYQLARTEASLAAAESVARKAASMVAAKAAATEAH